MAVEIHEAGVPLVNVKETERFQKHAADIERVLVDARALAKDEPVKDAAEAGRIADTVNALAHARKEAQAARLNETVQYRATTDSINAGYNELCSPVEGAERALKMKGLAWQRAEEARAAEEARRRQEEIDRVAEAKAKEAQEAAELAEAAAKEAADEKEQAEMQELADEAREEAAAAAVAPPAVAAPTPRQTRGAIGKLGSRTEYRFEIEDESRVPEWAKVVSRDAIKARISTEAKAIRGKQGATFDLKIPGVRIYTVDVAVSR